MLTPIDPMNRSNYENKIGQGVIADVAGSINWTEHLSSYRWVGAGWQGGIESRLGFHNRLVAINTAGDIHLLYQIFDEIMI